MISVRVISIVLAYLVLLGLGGAGGVWLGARHYRPQLDAASAELVACPVARGSLEAAVAEQVRQVAEQHATAQRLLGPRTVGEQYAAVEAVIDQELGDEGGADVGDGCAGGMRRPAERRAAHGARRVDVPVVVPCRVPAVEVPAWATAGLRKGDDLQTKVRALLAERQQRIGYEARLLAANKACQD